MAMLGTSEWLILGVVAFALAWRFWPKSWPIALRPRFSLRWLLVAVLVIGLICGGLARWYAREARRRALLAELRTQQELTTSVIHQTRHDLEAAGRKEVSFRTEDSFGPDEWRELIETCESPDGRHMRSIIVEASGGCDQGILRPITIRISEAPQKGLFLDRLIRAYHARGWLHEVAPGPSADR